MHWRSFAVRFGGTSDTLFVPDDCPRCLFSCTWSPVSAYFEEGVTKVTHIDFTHPYCEELRLALIASANEIGIEVVAEDTYGHTVTHISVRKKILSQSVGRHPYADVVRQQTAEWTAADQWLTAIALTKRVSLAEARKTRSFIASISLCAPCLREKK